MRLSELFGSPAKSAVLNEALDPKQEQLLAFLSMIAAHQGINQWKEFAHEVRGLIEPAFARGKEWIKKGQRGETRPAKLYGRNVRITLEQAHEMRADARKIMATLGLDDNQIEQLANKYGLNVGKLYSIGRMADVLQATGSADKAAQSISQKQAKSKPAQPAAPEPAPVPEPESEVGERDFEELVKRAQDKLAMGQELSSDEMSALWKSGELGSLRSPTRTAPKRTTSKRIAPTRGMHTRLSPPGYQRTRSGLFVPS